MAASMSSIAAASTRAGSTGGSWIAMDARVPNERRPRIPANGSGGEMLRQVDHQLPAVGQDRGAEAPRDAHGVERRRADEPEAAVIVLDGCRCAAGRTERVRVQG